MTLVPTTRRPGPRTRAAAAAHLTDDQIDELGRELSLYVRQLAWLGTAPKSRQSGGKTIDDPDPQTRLQRMTARVAAQARRQRVRLIHDQQRTRTARR